jgi:hypothetical protein
MAMKGGKGEKDEEEMLTFSSSPFLPLLLF